jgi:hypothetical protein
MSIGRLFLGAGCLVAAALVGACSGDRGALEELPELSPPSPDQPSTPPTAADAAAPGTAASPARLYFKEKVFSALSACAGCHSAGTNGATIFMTTDADGAYTSLDGSGLILSPSPLLTKGPHALGAAPALDPNTQAPLVQKWLDMEAAERVGAAAPTNILAAVGACMSKDLFTRINLCSAQTKPRVGESGNNCTGCDYRPCYDCHTAGGSNTGFLCAQNADEAFAGTKTMPFLRRYVGLAGVEPVPSKALVNKSVATKTASNTAVHPWYELDVSRQKALDAFVNDAIAKYKAGGCTQ